MWLPRKTIFVIIMIIIPNMIILYRYLQNNYKKSKNISLEDFEKIRIDKVEKRGGFDKRIFLEREEEKESERT